MCSSDHNVIDWSSFHWGLDYIQKSEFKATSSLSSGIFLLYPVAEVHSLFLKEKRLLCEVHMFSVKNIIETSDPRPKQKMTSKTSKTYQGSPFGYRVFHLDFFSALRLFGNFWIALKGPFNFATEWTLKTQRVPLFTFFGTVTLIKILNFCCFFPKILCLQRFPFIFHILQRSGLPKSPKGPPFTILETL